MGYKDLKYYLPLCEEIVYRAWEEHLLRMELDVQLARQVVFKDSSVRILKVMQS